MYRKFNQNGKICDCVPGTYIILLSCVGKVWGKLSKICQSVGNQLKCGISACNNINMLSYFRRLGSWGLVSENPRVGSSIKRYRCLANSCRTKLCVCHRNPRIDLFPHNVPINLRALKLECLTRMVWIRISINNDLKNTVLKLKIIDRNWV